MTIKKMQALLFYLDLYDGEIDGINGPKTDIAVQKFYQIYGQGIEALPGAVAGAVPERKSYWDDIKFFTPNEFRCPCGKCDTDPRKMDETLVRALDYLRGELGRPIVISSGIRCATHNAEVGGVYNSKHLTYQAVDFACPGISSDVLNRRLSMIADIQYHYCIDGSYCHANV